MDKLETISRRIESYRNDMIDMQIELCSYPAFSPEYGGEGEAKKAEVLHQFLEKKGFDNIDVIKVSDLDAPSGFRPNIIARYPGLDSSKTIWIMTHMDVVPPGELSLWSGNPFKAYVEGGKIFGRGVEDNQQDMVASLYAVKAFHDLKISPEFNIGIALVADEETGNEKGLNFILKNSNPFQPQDLIIVPDAGNKDGTMIEIAEKSIYWIKIKTLGVQTHGSTPEKGKNSFKAASYLITKLDKLYKIFNQNNPIFSPPVSTFEPTRKEPNVPNINTIPGEDVFYMDCRVLPGVPLENVGKEIRKIARSVESLFQVKIELVELEKTPASPTTSPDAPVVHALKRAVKRVYGKNAVPTGIGGGTVAACFRHADYAAAGWSKIHETAHQPNEYCVIENMVGDAKVYAHIFLNG
ncbi:MAG: M20 family metallo-hydrolase [Candidatus Aminicenantes bacterium]